MLKDASGLSKTPCFAHYCPLSIQIGMFSKPAFDSTSGCVLAPRMKQTTYLRGHQAQHASALAHLVDPGNQVTLSVTKGVPPTYT